MKRFLITTAIIIMFLFSVLLVLMNYQNKQYDYCIESSSYLSYSKDDCKNLHGINNLYKLYVDTDNAIDLYNFVGDFKVGYAFFIFPILIIFHALYYFSKEYGSKFFFMF